MTDSSRDQHLALIDAALDLKQAGKQDRALEVLLDAREQMPDYAPLCLLLGVTYQELKLLDEAEASLRKALSLEPEYPEALQALGLLLEAREQWPAAADLLEEHLKHDPANLVTLRALTGILKRLEREDEAVRILEQAWAASDTQDTGLEVGHLLVDIGRLEEAESVLRRVAQVSDTAESLAELGMVLVMLGRHSDAVGCLTRALDKDATRTRTWRRLAYCYGEMGQPQQGLEAIERAIRLDGSHPRNWLMRGELLLQAGNSGEALEVIRRGIALADSDDKEAQPVLFSLVLNELIALAREGRAAEALPRLEEFRHRFPTEEQFPQWQVALLIGLERYEEALQVLDEACLAGLPAGGFLAPWRYEVLHLLGRADEAWDFAEPTLVTQAAEGQLESLAGAAFRAYEQRHVSAALSIFEQLHSYAPKDARFVNNLGFILTGSGRLSDARELLLRAVTMPERADMRPVTLANLGYLDMLEGDLAEAAQKLQDALALPEANGEAILRLAFWNGDAVSPDPVPYPTRWLPVSIAVRASLVTLALAEARVADAEEQAQKMIGDAPDSPWGYAMRGWVAHVRGDCEQARQAWQQALERTRDPQDRVVFRQWLEALPNQP